tara:strand:+ start:330 stop:1043 length:714 start_codon:yes stop_codon:yes gene_type:complete
LIVEEPMSIRLNETLVATTMRTPGNDFELAAGFCITEGLLGLAKIDSIRYCAQAPALEADFNDVTVETLGNVPIPTARLGPASSSCGICGTVAIEDLLNRLSPLTIQPFDLSVLANVGEKVSSHQKLFKSTGSVHAAAAFDRTGELLVVREDIGRHNAVDKVIGRLYFDQIPQAGDLGLWVSGRISFEIVQKAWAAGFAALVGVSGPSALAIKTAETAGIQVLGFVREGNFNVYTGQ